MIAKVNEGAGKHSADLTGDEVNIFGAAVPVECNLAPEANIVYDNYRETFKHGWICEKVSLYY